MKWRRLISVLMLFACIFGVTTGTSKGLWQHTKLGLDLQGGYDLVYQIDSKGHALSAADKQAVLTAVELRVNGAGIGSPIIELEDQSRIHVELAGFRHGKEPCSQADYKNVNALCFTLISLRLMGW